MKHPHRAPAAPLLAVVLALALALYAGTELLTDRPGGIGAWFTGAALLHDLAFLPAYVAADALLVALWRRHPGRVPWLNFVRIPLAVSGILLLVYSPEILRLSGGSFAAKTGRSDSAYAPHWLLIAGVLAAVSGVWYLIRVYLTRPRPDEHRS